METGAITAGMIRIESGLAIQDILELELVMRKNSHGRIRIRGTVPESVGLSPAMETLEGRLLVVSVPEGTERKPIFCGRIHSLRIEQTGNGYMAVVEGITATVLLDGEEKCRSFQNVNMTCRELVRTVLADTPGASVLFHTEDTAIGQPIYQYRETDMAFLRRVAARFGTSLFPGALSDRPELHFGLPDGKWHEERAGMLRSVRLDPVYDDFCRRWDRVRKEEFLCRDLAAPKQWAAGDYLSLAGGGVNRVLAVRAALENGLLVWHYETASAKAFQTPPYENPLLAGIALEGTVLAVRKESVRIWLDIDREQPEDTAFWYPWLPAGGNLMYCMPEQGERAALLFTTIESGGRAEAVRCIRGNGVGNRELQDPSRRTFTTAQSKRLYFWPKEMGVTDLQQKITQRVVLEDTTGISIESCKSIHLTAREHITLGGSRVTWRAPQEISVFRRDMSDPASLNLCNGFDCIGRFTGVTMEADGTAGLPAVEHAGQSYDLRGAEWAVIGSTPRMAGRTGLEWKITGTQVHAIMADRES